DRFPGAALSGSQDLPHDPAAPGPAAPGLPVPVGSASGQAAAPHPGIVNVANELTVLRLVMVPFFVVFLAMGGTAGRVVAFVLFIAASATDLLDGRLARQRGLITDFGKIADPVADKALTGSALITLSALGELSWWVTGVILVRELGITALRIIVI